VEPCDISYSFRVKFPYNLTIGNLLIVFQCLSCMQPDGLGAQMGHQLRMMTTKTLSVDLKHSVYIYKISMSIYSMYGHIPNIYIIIYILV